MLAIFLCCAVFLTTAPFGVFASTTDGTIDATSKWGWGEKIGWINFGISSGNIHITDSAITGYAWNENYGWINMAPIGSGVKNDGEGNLSGQAWGENLGYIDFEDVSISSAGSFSGSASGTLSGRISFDCSSCGVETDWRPASSRGGGGSGGGGGGSGGGVSPALSVSINNNDVYTSKPIVVLNISFDSSVSEMMVANFPDFRDGIKEVVRSSREWNLCVANGIPNNPCVPGVKTVYVRFYEPGGSYHGPYTDSIWFGPVAPAPSTIPQIPGPSGPSSGNSWTGNIGEILEPWIPDVLRPDFLDDIFISVPKQSPLSMSGEWNLLAQGGIREFVFRPLSNDFEELIAKFPEIKRIFNEIGITRQADIYKLSRITLTIPGLTGTSLENAFGKLVEKPEELPRLKKVVLNIPGFTEDALPDVRLYGRKPALPPGIPVAELPVEIKMGMPTEVLFAKAGNEKIDLDIAVSLTNEGDIKQTVQTVAGSVMRLVVRPEAEAERVSGYLALRKARMSRAADDAEKSGVQAASILGAIVFSGHSIAAPFDDVRMKIVKNIQKFTEWISGGVGFAENSVEDRFALREFDYVDPDGDGLYTATIQAPVVDGEYDIYTIIRYKDPNRPNREIRLTAVIDPEGYVYEENGGRETRIPGARVTLYHLSSATGEYEVWKAAEYGQINPQVTDIRGTYAFLVPPGMYYTTIEADGYKLYAGEPYIVETGGQGIHQNIKLTSRYGYWATIDWKSFLLIIVSLFLAYNFYRDRNRPMPAK